MKNSILALSVFAMLLVAPYVGAEPTLKDKFTDEELIQILKNEGFSAVTKKSNGKILIKSEGQTYVLFNKDDGDLQAYYGIHATGVSYEEINRWNKTKRLSRAYLDDDNDSILESDFLANAGLTEKHVTEFISVWIVSAEAFKTFIGESSD